MRRRERFLKTLCSGEPDRIFSWGQSGPWGELCIWKKTLERWYSEGLRRDSDIYGYFGFEYKEIAPINLGMIPSFESVTIEETSAYRIISNGSGIKQKVFRGDSDSSMPQFLEFPVKSRKDFSSLKKRYETKLSLRYPKIWNDLKYRWKNRDYPLGIFCGSFFGQIRNWMGLERLLFSICDDPMFIEEMMEFLAEFYVEVIKKAVKEVRFDYAVFWEDMAYKTGPLISPLHFKKFMVPNYEKVTNLLRSSGINVIMVDSDGNINELIPLWIEGGINCFWPLEVAAGMNFEALRKLQKQYGKEISLIGGIDKRALAKDEKAIKEEVFPKVPYLVQRKNYIPCIDHHIPPDVSLKNYLYYLSLVERITEGR